MHGMNKILTLLVTYFLSLVIHDRLLGCEALFNRGNNNKNGDGDSNNKNRIAIHDAGKAKSNNPDDLMQSINDAATGTVKQTAPGNERPPTTCNEMMARAVVLANEERALAYDERDEALETAQQAITQLGQANIKLTDATTKVAEIEQEIQDLRETTANTIKEIKEETRLEIETNFNKTRLEMEDLKNMTSFQILQHENQKKEAIHAAEQKSAKEIADYKKLRDEDVAKIQEEAKAQMDNATLWVLENQNATRLEIESIQAKATEMVDAANSRANQVELDANATIIRVRKEANETINEAKEQAFLQVEQANADFTRQRLEIEKEMKKTRDDADEAIEKAGRNAKDAISEMKQALEKEEARLLTEQNELFEISNATVQSIMEEAQSNVTAAEVAANELIAQMKKESDAKVAFAEKSAAERIAAIEKELELAQNEAKRLVAAVEKLKTEGYRYADQVSHITDELAHWKGLHQSQQYCNVTLMKVDSSRALSRAANAIAEESKKIFDKTSTTTTQQFDRATLLVREKSQPHLEKLNQALDPHIKSVKKTYEESILKETVDKQVYPMYKQHVVPASLATGRLLKKMRRKIKQLAGQSWDFTIKKSVKVARWELKTINSNPNVIKWTPSFFIQFLEYIREYMEEWLLFKIKVTAFIVALVFRQRLLQLVISAAKFPFQVVWFFCPLRLCIKGGKKVEPGQNESSADRLTDQSGTKPKDEIARTREEGKKADDSVIKKEQEIPNGKPSEQGKNGEKQGHGKNHLTQ